MNEETYTPPTTVDEAYRLVAPLEPNRANLYTEAEKQLAFDRLMELINALLPDI